MTRRLLGLLTIVLTAIVGVVAVPAVAPAGAVATGFEVTVPAGEGVLQIRDADEAQQLASPTKISGTVDDETGVISGATLSTPPVNFDTVALGLPVDVTATFTQVTPGGGTGLVTATPPAAPDGEDQKGQVTMRDSVKVDLVLKIGNPIIIEAHCVSTPVNLELISEGAYTESQGGLIVDANFTMPPVQTTPDCISQVSGPVNELLAGSGHSLSMFIEGDLPVPPLKAETETTLSVDPSGGSMRGNPVTLTAAVAPVETTDLDPTGSVVFKEGTRILGTADVQPDGTASLTTTELRAGERALTAAYQGDAEFAPSTSAPLVYSVAPAPILTGTFPEYIPRGAPPVEFDLTIDNLGSNRPVTNGRVDLTFPTLNIGQLVLERQLPDSTWVPVPLPIAFGGIAGTLGPDDGTVVPAGGSVTYHLRISATGTAELRAATVDFKLVSVNPDAGEDGPTVATTSWPFNIVRAARAETTTFVGVYDEGGLRPGQTLYVDTTVTSPSGTVTTGEVEFLLDGKVVPSRPITFGPLPPLQNRAPVVGGSAAGRVILPSDLATGPHVVTARYIGDSSFLPSTSQEHVLPIHDPLGLLYTCDYVTVVADRMGAYVQAYVRLPSYAEDGEELDLEDLDIKVIPGGIITPDTLMFLQTSGNVGVSEIEIDLGDAGTITGDSVAYEANYDITIPSDQILELQNLEGTIVVDGEPGDIMPLPIERIEMSGVEMTIGAGFTFTCTPQAEATVLEDVGVAGVSLTAETSTDPVRTGHSVVLTATTAPAGPFGLVEFFSGAQSLGTASGATGTATITVDDLPAGTNLLTARYSGVPGSPYQSNIVEIRVRPATECPGFNDPGHGKTVRLVYLELLQRCPDQAGYAYWVGQLGSGVTREAFAREISKSFEARKVFVDKAYRLMLGRPADEGGKAFWAARLANGRFDRLIADLGSSAEFWNQAGGTNEGFVRLVYERILKREASNGDVAYWAGRLQAGESRRALILTLFNLTEPLSVVGSDAYREILCRAPNATETAAGVALMRASSNLSTLYGRLIGTEEFVVRAQTSPNPEDC